VRFLIVAAGVHLALALALPRARSGHRELDDAASADALTIDLLPVESVVAPSVSSDPPRAALATANPTRQAATHGAFESAPFGRAALRALPGATVEVTRAVRESASIPETTSVDEPRRPTDERPPWTFDPRGPFDPTAPDVVARAGRDVVTADVAAGREGVDVRDGPQTHAGIPRGASTSGGVAEALDARDAALGLGRGGAVLSALEGAFASSDAPSEGIATFDVGIDTSGHVSVAVVDVSVASPGWARVAAAARAAIDPARVRIPPGARGWRVVARVEAKAQYPNGADPKKLGTSVTASPGSLAEDKNRPDAHAPPLVLEKVPGVTLAHSGKVCSVNVTLGLTLSPISGGCDPSNIGMKPLRVVHARIVSEGRL
jgi:hypothetical protein